MALPSISFLTLVFDMKKNEGQGNEILKPRTKIEGKRLRNIATYDWLDRMSQLVNQLEKHPDIEVLGFETHPSLPLVVEETMSDSAGFEIPEEILSFYRISDGFNLDWRVKANALDIEIGGTIKMFGFGEVFGNWIDTLWGITPENASAPILDFSWELRGLDRANSNADYWTVLHAPENCDAYRLYFHNPTGASHLLDMSFSDYLDALLLTRGIHGWQFLLSDEFLPPGSTGAQHALRSAEILTTLFPKDDFSSLEIDDILFQYKNENNIKEEE